MKEALLVAVQSQFVPRVTLMTIAPIPPAAGKDWFVSPLNANVHEAARCVTVNVSPAIVSVPRRSPPVFAATAAATTPLPSPPPLSVIVMKSALLAAVHLHPEFAVIAIVTEPPLASTV
jgi:hypothetical protein